MITDRPGIDHAVATAAQVLHAATWLDFKTHIASLVQAGKLREAFRCWVSVVEIFHAPWTSPSLGEFDELPPLRRAACGEFPCDRCATRRGGFKFPWLGTWTSRGVLVPHGANPMEAWAHYQRNTEKLDLILLAMYSSPLEADDVCPQEMYGLQLRPLVHPDRPGLADTVEIFAYWRVWLGALGGWNAAESLQQIAAARARQWREREGFTRDEDFAFAFVDFDHAVGSAGHHVADEWLAVRARVNEGLLHAGAQVAEGRPLPVRSLKPARKTILKHKARTVAVTKPADVKVARRIQHLTSMFVGMGSFKPAGILTDSRRSEWKQTCERIAQQKVRAAEPATMDRVVNTWLELKQWLEIRGLSAPPGTVDLDHFMQSASAPARAMQALRWMNKHAQLDMDLGNVVVTVPRAAAGPKGQAPVAEPVLIPLLEDRVKELHDLGDERWVSPTFGQLLKFSDQELSALGDWQEKKDMPTEGQMALHYSSAKYAASLKVKAMIWGATPVVAEHLSWEAIPEDDLVRAKAAGAQAVDRLTRADRQPLWAASGNFQDVQKRLKLSKTYVEKAAAARARAAAPAGPTMPNAISGKVLSATMKNGAKLCPLFQVGTCPNEASNCTHGAHLCAILQKTGRTCGGKHPANQCKIKKFVSEDTVLPVQAKPTAALIPAATGPKVATRKRSINLQEAKAEVLDERKRARTSEVAQPKTPPKAKARPKGGVAQPVTPPKAAAVVPQPIAPPRVRQPVPAEEAVDRRLEQLGVGGGKTAQAPTLIWESVRGGRLYLSGLPTRATAAQFPEVALQVCCFPGGPECRQGVTLRGAQLMTFSAAYASQRSEQWRELEHWLELDPRAFREWAMTPMAAVLGLTDGLHSQRPGLPSRGAVDDYLVDSSILPPECSAKKSGLWARTVSLLQGINALPKAVALPVMKQESIVLAFRKLFPAAWFDDFQFGMIEDLVNSPPFSCYPEWLASQGEAWDGPLTPHLASGVTRQLSRIGEGNQVGAMTHRAALPPLLPFNLSPDVHFQQALQRAQQPLPHEGLAVVDKDLEFAADFHEPQSSALRAWRQRAIGAMRELKRRWQGVTLHLRHFQEPALQQVTRHRDIGLIALLMVLTSWSDTGLPFGLVRGLPAVGYAPAYGVFPQQPAVKIGLSEVLDGWQDHSMAILSRLKPGKDDRFLLEQSLDDASKGFCTQPLSASELQRLLKGAPYRLIPRHVITQSSGKQRVIDDGHPGGQSERSSDANKLTLCSALRPAQHIALAMRRWSPAQLALFQEGDSWETGQEDLPSAYRFCPVDPVESRGCIVVLKATGSFGEAVWEGAAVDVFRRRIDHRLALQ
eukprot:Skav224194  [mRNA]  locus=scaffold939:277414:285540:+ [translate_table: standard]